MRAVIGRPGRSRAVRVIDCYAISRRNALRKTDWLAIHDKAHACRSSNIACHDAVTSVVDTYSNDDVSWQL